MKYREDDAVLPIKNIALFLAVALPLAACVSEEERRAQQQAQYQTDVAAAGSHCTTIGFKKGTSLFAQCVQLEYQNILQQRELQFQKNQQFWQSIADAGAALQGDDEPSYNCKRDFGIMNTYTCDPM
jgi:hypothetical protein